MRLSVGAALVGAGVHVAACGPGFLDHLVGGTKDGGSATPTTPTTIGCVGLVPPDASASGIDGPSIEEVSLAFEGIRVSAADNVDASATPAPVGYNLDHLCTCEGDRAACISPDSGAPAQTPCDGDGGTDDALASFFKNLGVAFGEFQLEFASQRIADGLFTVLLQLSNWNGQPDDPQVTVVLRMSPGLDRDASGRTAPQFDGTDVWSVDPESIVQGSNNVGRDCRSANTDEGGIPACSGTVFDANAFFTNGQLIAHLGQSSSDTTPIILQSSVGRLEIELTRAVLHAQVNRDAKGMWRMTGELTGRWPVGSILYTIGNIESPFQHGTGICETADSGQSAYSILKAGVCTGLDLAATPSFDRDPDAPCTAMSSALSFTASTATAGHVVTKAPQATHCLQWTDDCSH